MTNGIIMSGDDFVVLGNAAIAAGAAILFDIRAPEGDTPIIDRIRDLLAADVVVGLCDSDEVMLDFAIGRIDGVIVVIDATGERSNFATIEAALKHGLTRLASDHHVG